MKKILVVFSILLLSLQASAQKSGKPDLKKLSKDEIKKYQTAEYFYSEENYLRALPIFVELMAAHPEDLYFKLISALCYLDKSDEKNKAIPLLKEVAEADPAAPDINLHLGKAYHLNYEFESAIITLNKYLDQKPAPPVNQQLLAKRYIENSKNAKVLMGLKVKCEITNIGDVINSPDQEYVPVISSDESILIYTYTGPKSTEGLMDAEFNPDPDGAYYEDVFISQRVGDTWLTPESIGPNINTKNHDASIALSSDGQKLFIFHSTDKDGGDIYMSTLTGNVWGEAIALGPNINTKFWEGSCSISADEQTLYFASERPGGSGGKDIYLSKKMPDGSWGKADNLGPAINTSFNEDSPFIHPDGITLFFSSEGHNSIGGYDIMYSTLKDGKWAEPVNIGYPINTTEDERYYVLTADGEHGYYSSDMKGGKGQQDIYSVTPGFFGEKPILALVVGTVFANDMPADATISVTNADTGEKKGTYHSNSASGKYLIALTPGNNYKVAIEVEGYEAQIQYVNVKSLETYVQVQKDFKFFSDDYKKQNNVSSVQDSSNIIQVQINDQIKRYNEERKAEIYEARVYQDILRKYGEEKKECVTFNLELGTFEKASDFNPEKIASLGTIKQRVDSLGTTFYFEGFPTLLSAEIFKYKVIDKDTSLNTVIVTINDCNNRKLIQEYYSQEYTRKDYTPPTKTKVVKEKKETGIIALNTGKVETNIVKDEGKSEISGLSYKLEIGAVDNPNDFKLQHLSKYGKIESKQYPDGKTRYTLGPFKTLAEAEAFKKMIVEKEPDAAQSFITVFFFGVRKTLEELNNPCNPNAPSDFSAFVGKDLNDKEVYNNLITMAGNNCAEGLIFKVQIGAYRKPQNFKHKNLNKLEPPPALVTPYPDGITRFTMREFTTIKDAEAFRQECIRLGTKDAWITAFYNGNRMLLQELIANNFFNKKIN
ncbi:MAG TPA: tetratricopeptide repeat protein [Bacteroidia bacterium]|jgi:hypothetical protein